MPFFFWGLQRVSIARSFILVVAPQNVARAAVGAAMMTQADRLSRLSTVQTSRAHQLAIVTRVLSDIHYSNDACSVPRVEWIAWLNTNQGRSYMIHGGCSRTHTKTRY
jgi:hypothetical protein